jgi:hypothetical protein
MRLFGLHRVIGKRFAFVQNETLQVPRRNSKLLTKTHDLGVSLQCITARCSAALSYDFIKGRPRVLVWAVALAAAYPDAMLAVARYGTLRIRTRISVVM